MTTQTDQQLLLAYAGRRSESAFAELVRRHVDLVYSTALRIVRNQHLAEDVTQGVFVAFGRNARQLTSRAALSGWLHRTAHNLAVNVVRSEERRRAREKEAVAMNEALSTGSDDLWERLAPHLDNALEELSDADRDALLLRFFQGKSAREIGKVFNLTDQAAQKRVERALDRLRNALAWRGLAMTGTALTAAISTQAAQAAPPGLLAGLAAYAFAQSAAAPAIGSFLSYPIQLMAQLKAKPIPASLMIVACLSLGTTGFVAGKTAAKKHHAAEAWRKAVLAAPDEPVVANEPMPLAAVSDSTGRIEAQNFSVVKILAEAAQYFRSVETDPDATAKGVVELQKLRPEDATESLRQLESYRGEPGVFRLMAPHVLKLWAQTEPRAAMVRASNLDYSTNRLENHHARALAQELISRVWAQREPEAAWEWYRQTSDSLTGARGDSSWASLPKPIFTEWAGRDAAGALAELEKAGSDDVRAAILGIAEAAAITQFRPSILSAIEQMKDGELRQRLAARMSEAWARVDPASAAEWASGLAFQDPLARLHVATEAFEEWWELDRRAAAAWMLTRAPGEVMDQLIGLASPGQLQKLRDAAR